MTPSNRFQFVVLAPNDWRGVWMNRQHLFSRIGRIHTVLYSTGLRSSWEWREAVRESALLERIGKTDNALVYEAPSWLLRVKRNSRADDVALRYFASRVEHHLKRLGGVGSGLRKNVLYVFHPAFLGYRQFIHHDALVYHAYDDFSTMGANDSSMSADEDKLLQDASLVITSSAAVKRKLSSRGLSSANVHFVPNGVDFRPYESATLLEPACLAGVPRPRIGYVGSINPKVDLDTIEHLSSRHPDKSFVFIGRVNALTGNLAEQWRRITDRPNLHCIPPQPQATVPALLSHCDVNCIYYSTSPENFGSAGYPLKLHECLASGRPVISSDIESVRDFSDVVLIARTPDDWSRKLTTALSEPEQSDEARRKRRAVARANSWDDRAQRILDLVNESMQLTSGRT